MTLVVALTAITGFSQGPEVQPPNGGGQGGPPEHRFHLLPPHAADKLNLTDDQKQQIAALESEVKAKLEQILTPQQLEQLKQMHPPRPEGGPGRGGPGGRGEHGGPEGGPATTGTTAPR